MIVSDGLAVDQIVRENHRIYTIIILKYMTIMIRIRYCTKIERYHH